jgi:hypothetical protein
MIPHKDEHIVAYLDTLGGKQREYANAYFRHLRDGTTQPQPELGDDFSYQAAQEIRLKLTGLVG